jgi:pSer/pThr/pTyr-binding forkhead associated (FHA) protein
MTGIVLLILRLLFAISLYALLGWAFLILWRELQIHSKNAQKLARPPALTISRDAVQRIFRAPELTIGRDPFCEYALEGDESTSSRHARLYFRQNQWWVEDLDSTNGTRLNGQNIVQPTVLTSGDIIQCGSNLLTIEIEEMEATP